MDSSRAMDRYHKPFLKMNLAHCAGFCRCLCYIPIPRFFVSLADCSDPFLSSVCILWKLKIKRTMNLTVPFEIRMWELQCNQWVTEMVNMQQWQVAFFLTSSSTAFENKGVFIIVESMLDKLPPLNWVPSMWADVQFRTVLKKWAFKVFLCL